MHDLTQKGLAAENLVPEDDSPEATDATLAVSTLGDPTTVSPGPDEVETSAPTDDATESDLPKQGADGQYWMLVNGKPKAFALPDLLTLAQKGAAAEETWQAAAAQRREADGALALRDLLGTLPDGDRQYVLDRLSKQQKDPTPAVLREEGGDTRPTPPPSPTAEVDVQQESVDAMPLPERRQQIAMQIDQTFDQLGQRQPLLRDPQVRNLTLAYALQHGLVGDLARAADDVVTRLLGPKDLTDPTPVPHTPAAATIQPTSSVPAFDTPATVQPPAVLGATATAPRAQTQKVGDLQQAAEATARLLDAAFS